VLLSKIRGNFTLTLIFTFAIEIVIVWVAYSSVCFELSNAKDTHIYIYRLSFTISDFNWTMVERLVQSWNATILSVSPCGCG